VAVEPRPRARGGALLGLVGLLLAIWGYGVWALRQEVRERGTIRTGLVQAAILQEEKWDPARALENVDRHVELTRRAADEKATTKETPYTAVQAAIWMNGRFGCWL